MRRYISFLAVGGSTACAGPEAGPIEAGDLVILNGRVFDGTGAAPIDDGLVAVRGEQIIAVGPREAFAAPASVTDPRRLRAGSGLL